MPNKTIRNLNNASQLNGGDFLVIAQTDGTTKKIAMSDFSSQSKLVTDVDGRSVSTNRFKVAVGHDSHIKGLDGVERSASNSWTDKAFMVVQPQAGQDEESVRQTDFCYFCAVQQPSTCLMINRPFISLDEALVWCRYNIPAGAEVQIEFWGHTTAYHNADSLGQFSPTLTQELNYSNLVFVPKMRWVGKYNDSTGFWDPGPYLGRWIPDLNFGTAGYNYLGSNNPGSHHINYKTRGGDGSGMVLNSTGTARKHKSHLTGTTKNSWNWDYGQQAGFSVATTMGTSYNNITTHVPEDIMVHLGGGSPLRFWFRKVQTMYIVGINWCDYALGNQANDQTFFRISNCLVTILGEPTSNVEAGRHVFANQRGPAFYTKHQSSTIFECTEGAKIYIMSNIRQYSVGATESFWDKLQSLRGDLVAAGANIPSNLGASNYWDWLPYPRQALTLCKLGINSTGINVPSYVIFDPLLHGWRRYLGTLCADNGDLKYSNGEKMIGYSLSNNFTIKSGSNSGQLPLSGVTAQIPAGANLIDYDAPDNNTVGFFTPPAVDWGESHNSDGRLLPQTGPSGWLLTSNESQGMHAGGGSLPIPRMYKSWGYTGSTGFTSSYNYFYGKVTPADGSFLWDNRWGTNHAPCTTWNIASINDNGTFVCATPGAIYGPNQGTNGDQVYSMRGYRHFAGGLQNIFTDDALDNHNPAHPDNYKFLNTKGGTNFHQMFFTDWTARIGNAILFTPESAYNFSTDNGSIAIKKQFNIASYYGWVDWLFGDFTGLTAQTSHLETNSGHMMSFYLPNTGKTGGLPNVRMFNSSGVSVQEPTNVNNTGRDLTPYALSQSYGASVLPLAKDVYWSAPPSGASQSWGSFYYEPQGFFRYRGDFGNHLTEQLTTETPAGSSITIGGGSKEENSVWPGTQKPMTTAAKAIGNNRLVLHPMTSAIQAHSGWFRDWGWFDQDNAEKDGDLPNIAGAAGYGDQRVNMTQVAFGLEAYQEMHTVPWGAGVDSSTGLQNYPSEATMNNGWASKSFYINGSHPNAGKFAFGGAEGGGMNYISDWS